MKNHLILCGLLCCLVTACTPHGETGDKLRLERKWTEAAQEYQKGADSGEAYSMWRLADAYGRGLGVEFNDSIALVWLKKAAEANCEEAKADMMIAYFYGKWGQPADTVAALDLLKELEGTTTNSYALSEIASVYWTGIGTQLPQDKNKAVEILNSVPDKLNPQYLYRMGFVKVFGTDDIEVNEEEAIKYWQQSFELGGHGAFEIALLYHTDGSQETIDLDKAVEWYKKGIEMNDPRSMLELARIYSNQTGKYEKYEDKKRALHYVKKAISLGYGDAADKLGCWYSSGFIVEQDYSKAFECFQLANKYGSATGTFNLGILYLNGIGCAQTDPKKAVKLWIDAANMGCVEAAWNLYIDDNITGFSLEEKNKYLLMAANGGHLIACYNLALSIVKEVNGFSKNYEQAFFYAKKAADGGYIPSYKLISILYRNGYGTEKNIGKANEYSDKANGH